MKFDKQTIFEVVDLVENWQHGNHNKKVGLVKHIMKEFNLDIKDGRKLYDIAYRRIHRRQSTEKLAEKEVKGNNIYINSKAGNPRTIDDVYKEYKINKDEWTVERFRVNEYDQSPNFTCHQIRADLKHIKPELCEYPPIQAVRLPRPNKIIHKKPKKGLKKFLIIPDLQIGYSKNQETGELVSFHDFRCMDIYLQIAKKFKPDEIIFLGDMLDLPAFGKYQLKPEYHFTTQASLNTLRLFIDDLLPHTSKLVYLYGNHEARFRNSMIDYNVEACNLKKVDFKAKAPDTYSLEYFLDLDNIGVQYISEYPQGEYYINNNFACSHGHLVGGGSGQTVNKIIQADPHVSRMVGHIHRCEQATKTTYKMGVPHTNSAFSCGCGAKLGDAVPQHSTRPNWQQGFSTGFFEDGDGLFNVRLHHIEQGSAVFDGSIIQADVDYNKLSNRIGYNIIA